MWRKIHFLLHSRVGFITGVAKPRDEGPVIWPRRGSEGGVREEERIRLISRCATWLKVIAATRGLANIGRVHRHLLGGDTRPIRPAYCGENTQKRAPLKFLELIRSFPLP